MATLFFQLVILAALVLMAILPIALLILLIENWRNWRKSVPLAITAMVLAGFLLGGAIGWACRPDAWTMPLWQTAEAAGNAEKYGHPLESQAERVLLYFLFSGVLGAAAAALAAPLLLRYSTNRRPPSASSADASGSYT